MYIASKSVIEARSKQSKAFGSNVVENTILLETEIAALFEKDELHRQGIKKCVDVPP
jgi:hypothetical protein